MGDANDSTAKRKLGIPSLRNRSKEKVAKLKAKLPEMASEVQLKIIEQFPAFRDLGKANIDAVAEAHKSALAANEASQNQFYKAAQDQRDALQADLNRDDLSWEQRDSLHDRYERNVGRVDAKDSESKLFQGAAMKLVAATGAVVVVLGAAFVGVKVAGASEDGSEESQ